MATLPPSSDFTGSSVTEGQFKTALTSLRTFIADLLGTSSTDKVAARTALGVPLAAKLDKSGAYTVVAADCGKVINATTGTWSLSLTAAATLGDGFHFALQNSGAGTVTIDPNASETIDGATTKDIAAGKFVMVYCDGTKFATTSASGKAPTSQTFTANGTWTRPTDCIGILIVGWGGGCGGGGANITANQNSSGGLGSQANSVFVASPASSYAVTIGAGGAGAAGSASTSTTVGSAGSDTTVGAVFTAKGAARAATYSSNLIANVVYSGGGGNGPGGAGGAMVTGSAAGNAGAANSGAGGSGAADNISANRTGGAGGSGYVLIVEFY